MKNTIGLGIVIPTFNRADELEKNLISLESQSYKNFEVIIVDDGPSADTTQKVVEEYRERNKKTHFLQLTQKGCVIARNTGAEKSKGKIILTMDDDVELIHNSTLNDLVMTFQNDPTIGVVGGIEVGSKNEIKFLNESSGKVDPAIGRILANGYFDTRFKELKRHEITNVDHVRSAFMAVRKDIFNKLGGFDESYTAKGMGFRYESDLCLKVKELGYRVVVNPKLVIWHKGSKRQRGFKRGRGMDYFFYANRNHVFFMRRFFWKTSPLISLFKDLLVGTYRTPGVLFGVRRLMQERDWRWLGYIPVSIAGKVAGYYRYDRIA